MRAVHSIYNLCTEFTIIKIIKNSSQDKVVWFLLQLWICGWTLLFSFSANNFVELPDVQQIYFVNIQHFKYTPSLGVGTVWDDLSPKMLVAMIKTPALSFRGPTSWGLWTNDHGSPYTVV